MKPIPELVYPTSKETPLNVLEAPYQMVVQEQRTHFYKGTKKVYDCDAAFAKEHFAPTAEGRPVKIPRVTPYGVTSIAYKTAFGPVHRVKLSRYPGEDKCILNVRTVEQAGDAHRKLNGRTLRVSEHGTGYFPLTITVNGRYYA